MYSSTGKAVITYPLRMVRVLEKRRQEQFMRMKKFSEIFGVNKRESSVVIACKDRTLSHYAGMRYPRDRLLLATEHWKKKKQDGDYFTILCRSLNEPPEVIAERRERRPFEELSSYLSKPILKSIENMGLKSMALIQRRAIAPIVDGRNAFIGATMGSGKTLAFMVPIIERLHRLRKTEGEPAAGFPRALILSPTRELTEQLFNVSKKLITDESSIGITMIRSGDGNVYANELEQPGRDLLIATVGTAIRHKKLDVLKLEDLRHVVVDEADILLAEAHRDGLFRLLKDVKFNRTIGDCGKESAQLILVASTCPDDLGKLSSLLIGENTLMHLTDDHLHVLPWYLVHRFLRLTRQFAPEALLQYVKSDVENKIRVAVFARDAKTCEWLEHFLTESGVPVVALRGTLSDTERSNSYHRIMTGDFMVMVATDAASLGLDTQHLKHVINYGLPETVGGYLRRAGRLGRFQTSRGRTGVVTSFIMNFWEVDFVQELERSVRLNIPLSVHDIVRDRCDYEE